MAKSEAARQKAREKKNRRRAFLRDQHLKRIKGERMMAEHDHWIRFHTSPDELTEAQKQHPEEDHTGHDHGPIERSRVEQLAQPVDVGTTRMKIEGYEDVTEEIHPAGMVANQLSPEELRKELGLG
jgi:hypothetical protein